ncbi:LysM peptidoglycan-binding domain-containing protein [Budvicia aquatica]|nr:LysM peptidoglycan-binding domain-containing protein [Budvicia aquatica]
MSIGLQLLLPLNLYFSPAIAKVLSSSVMAPSKISDTVPYILKTGESVDSIAKINNLTLDELTQLNQFRSFSKPFKSLSVGDEIDIPRRISLPLMGSGNEVSDTIPPSLRKNFWLGE